MDAKTDRNEDDLKAILRTLTRGLARSERKIALLEGENDKLRSIVAALVTIIGDDDRDALQPNSILRRLESLERAACVPSAEEEPRDHDDNSVLRPPYIYTTSRKCLSCGSDPLVRIAETEPPSSPPDSRPQVSSHHRQSPVSVGRRSGLYGVERLRGKQAF